jgi:serine/threonine protein kinase
MKYVCLVCERESADGNLYCERPDCPAELSPSILEEGEWIGEIEIVKPVSILRSSTIYAATRQDEDIFVKVAHRGGGHRERLKREADMLHRLRGQKIELPYLPAWLPPYTNSPTMSESYGKIGYQGQLLYYHVFESAHQDSLRSLLRKRPQLWINHVGWIMISVSTALAYLHRNNVLHCGLSPEAVLVRFDEKPPQAPRVLLADLGLLATKQNLTQAWYPDFLFPAYTAPEYIDEHTLMIRNKANTVRLDIRSDVYGLGLLLSELLTGESVIRYKRRSEQDIYHDILKGVHTDLSRKEDLRRITEVAAQAVAPKITRRQESAAAFGQQLLQYFGDVPPEKKSRMPSRRTLWTVGGAVILIILLLAMVLMFLT